jgi:hypothetical protein
VTEKKRRRVEPEGKVERTEETVTGLLGEPCRREVEHHVHGILDRVRTTKRGALVEPDGVVVVTIGDDDSFTGLTPRMVREHCEAILADLGPPPPDNAAHPAALAREVLDWLDVAEGRKKYPPVPGILFVSDENMRMRSALIAGRLYGRIEATLEHERDALIGKQVRTGNREALAELARKRRELWTAKLATAERKGSRPRHGEVERIAREIADALGSTPEAERRWYERNMRQRRPR